VHTSQSIPTSKNWLTAWSIQVAIADMNVQGPCIVWNPCSCSKVSVVVWHEIPITGFMGMALLDSSSNKGPIVLERLNIGEAMYSHSKSQVA